MYLEQLDNFISSVELEFKKHCQEKKHIKIYFYQKN